MQQGECGITIINFKIYAFDCPYLPMRLAFSYENTAVKQDWSEIYSGSFCPWDLISLWSLEIHTVFQNYKCLHNTLVYRSSRQGIAYRKGPDTLCKQDKGGEHKAEQDQNPERFGTKGKITCLRSFCTAAFLGMQS